LVLAEWKYVSCFNYQRPGGDERKGINRAEIWDVAAIRDPTFIPAGGEFLGDESVGLIKHAIAEGKRLKISIGIVAKLSTKILVSLPTCGTPGLSALCLEHLLMMKAYG